MNTPRNNTPFATRVRKTFASIGFVELAAVACGGNQPRAERQDGGQGGVRGGAVASLGRVGVGRDAALFGIGVEGRFKCLSPPYGMVPLVWGFYDCRDLAP
jgi:hypothetical protein